MRERVLESGSIVVIDIGKTLSKVSLWSRSGRCVARETRANAPQPGAPYAALDTEATAEWVIATLASFASHQVEAIVPVAHGAAIAGIAGGHGPAFVPPDYEWPIPPGILADYRAMRDPFAVTGSAALPGGLNIGSQLHFLETLGLLDEVTLMPLAQYWAWLLSGVAVSEVTSLGCHSDLWAPAAGDFSPLAKARGWAAKFAPLARAGDAIGMLRPDLAARTGLSPEVRIHAGLHDSNAALLAARGFPQVADKEVTVLSTGTWFIAMRSPRDPVDLAALAADRDCLVNVDVFGQAVPSARFMGGREIELLGARIDRPGTVGLADVLHSGAMVLPSHAAGCGPFPQLAGRWINFPADADEKIAAVALYAALMADTSLDLIGAKERLVIEGRFARSEIFVRALATLRPGTQVFAIDDEADVSFGALRLLCPELVPHRALTPVEPLDRDLSAYRDEWLDDIEVFS
jgi:sugar (pentulose or hexulose) kinase